MTLIVEFYDSIKNHSVWISDCLVTEGVSQREKYDFTPMHAETGLSIPTLGASFASKVFTRSNRIILCSGDVHVLEPIAREFVERGFDHPKDFQSFIDASSDNRRLPASFIYSQRSGGRNISSDTNCLRFSCGHIDVFAGGTGAKYLKEIFEGATPDPDIHVLSLAAEAIAILLRKEFADYDFPSHHFGGAYEMVVAGQSGFERVPYAVVDVIGESDLAEDGVYDVNQMSVQRVIVYIPKESGTLVFVVADNQGNAMNRLFVINELGISMSDDEAERYLLQNISAIRQVFSIVLLRHLDVNFRITADQLLSFWVENGRLEMKVDVDRVSKLLGRA